MAQTFISKREARKLAETAQHITRYERVTDYGNASSVEEREVSFETMMQEVQGHRWFANQAGGELFINWGDVSFTCILQRQESEDRRGAYLVKDVGCYEIWQLAYTDGTFGESHIVSYGQYDTCTTCNRMWPVQYMTPGFPTCPDCSKAEQEEKSAV